VTGTASGQEVALEPPVRPWYRVASPRDEAALIRQARSGSADAVEALVRRHWDGAHRAAFLIVHDAGAAEDIAQEAMLAAVRSIDRFDRRRPFKPWLHRIVVNRSLDWLRARARRLIDLWLATDSEGNEHALARRMGIQEIIWNCRSWWSGSDGMGNYSVCFTDRGKRRRHVNRTEAHMDHIHIGLSWEGARKRTSFWAR